MLSQYGEVTFYISKRFFGRFKDLLPYILVYRDLISKIATSSYFVFMSCNIFDKVARIFNV